MLVLVGVKTTKVRPVKKKEAWMVVVVMVRRKRAVVRITGIDVWFLEMSANT